MLSFQHEINIQADLVLLHFADTAFLSQLTVCIKGIRCCYFSNICSLHVCVTLGQFSQYFKLFLFVMMICNQYLSCYCCKKDYNLLWAQMMVGIF